MALHHHLIPNSIVLIQSILSNKNPNLPIRGKFERIDLFFEKSFKEIKIKEN